jgi:hypothetical protein
MSNTTGFESVVKYKGLGTYGNFKFYSTRAMDTKGYDRGIAVCKLLKDKYNGQYLPLWHGQNSISFEIDKFGHNFTLPKLAGGDNFTVGGVYRIRWKPFVEAKKNDEGFRLKLKLIEPPSVVDNPLCRYKEVELSGL